jgi:Predicted dehydrogenases and related proteins
MSKNVTRRQVIKQMSLAAGTALPLSNYPFVPAPLPDIFIPEAPEKPITAITLGAGNRGNVYGNYATAYPHHISIVGVAEPITLRNQRYARQHNIPETNRFKTWEDVFKKPKFADAVIISTPDWLHYGPCMKALEMGYHVLLEKPISPSEKECRDILAMAKKTGRIVAVCHVLRYAPYFVHLRQLIQSGAIGELISFQHFEPIEHVHMAHSYVRGNWHNSKQTTPILLAKSCHDMDILRWIIGKPTKSVSAFGNLKWFRKANAPEGSTDRCINGCAVESTCPYSALKIYHRNHERLYVFDLPEDPKKKDEAILEYLRTTDYGRCVYRMENDQPDHYVSNILFENDVTASFSMEAFTSYHGRRTRVMGSMGDIVGDMTQFTLTDFRTGVKTNWALNTDHHGGGDWRLMANFVQAVSKEDAGLLTSTIDVSIESHIMCFMAEQSRLQKKVVDLVM